MTSGSRQGLLAVALVLVLAGLYGVATWLGDRRSADDAPRELLAPFAVPLVFPEPGRDALRSDDLAGRPAVISFWATWCAPCKEERPLLIALNARGLAPVVGIATMDREDAVRAAEAAAPHGYPIGLDPEGDTARSLGVTTLPHTLVVDASGRVVRRIPRKLTEPDVEAIVRLLAAGGTTP